MNPEDIELGYFALWRKFFNHPFWREKRSFSKAEAWIDILRNTQYNREPQQRLIRGRLITQQYGEAIMSTRYCASAWNWHKTKVERFFRLLENMEMLSQKCVHSVNILIVTNFASYDIRQDTNVDTGVDASGTLARHWCGQSKESKERKEGKDIPPISPKGGFVFPEWLDKKLWSDFKRMRSKIKKPITSDLTVKRLLNALKKLIDQGHNQQEIIQTAIDHCWQSFYEPKNKSNNSDPSPEDDFLTPEERAEYNRRKAAGEM